MEGNMKKMLSIVLMAVLGAFCLSAQSTESAKIAGKWQMSIETPHGPMKGPLEVKQDGAKFTGTYNLEQFGSMTLTGKLEGDKVTFSVEVPNAGMTLAFTGTVAGDKMSGSTDHAGNWTATR